MPITRGRAIHEELEPATPHVPQWQERLAVIGLAALVLAMIVAMWRIMSG